MVIFTWNRKGFGIYGLNIPWKAWPGVIAGFGLTGVGAQAVGIEEGENSALVGVAGVTNAIVGGVGSYYFFSHINK